MNVGRRAAALALLGALALAGAAGQAGAAEEWIDLTHPLAENSIFWPTAKPFHLVTEAKGMTDAGYYYSAYSFSAAEHGGTHIDAPVHFAEGRQSVDEIPLSRLIGTAAVIDVSVQAERDRDYLIGVADIRDWETQHGTLPAGTIVLFRTGFDRYWPDAEQYLGTAARGQAGVDALSFPGLDPDAARWLVSERKVGMVGIDTASIDRGKSKIFGSHVALMTANVPALENVARLDRLPPIGATLVALPVKIQGGSGGPVRIIAQLP